MAGQYRDLGDVSGAVTIDASRGNTVRMRLVGAVVFTIVNVIDGEPLVLQVVQDGVGGHTINWNGGLQVANPPQPQADAASTTTFLLYGLDAQDQAAGTAIFVGGINASGSGGPAGIPVVGGWLTIANTVGASNGISLTLLTGDAVRVQEGAFTLATISNGGAGIATCNFPVQFLMTSPQMILRVNGSTVIQSTGNNLGFFGSAAVAKPTVTGAKGGNAALTSLCAQLAALGLITDSTT